MFYYYGRKKALAGKYPEPSRGLEIIEHFAGSAAYSLHGNRWKRSVTLWELDPRIAGLWKWLQEATPNDVRSLPSVSAGDRLDKIKSLSTEEHLLISLHAGPGKNKVNNVVSKFSRWAPGQRYISSNLHKIKHWTIREGDGMGDTSRAFHFIDAPYQGSAGLAYHTPPINFDRLREFSMSIGPQVVVCEKEGANWLPFSPLIERANCGKRKCKEVIWTSGVKLASAGKQPWKT